MTRKELLQEAESIVCNDRESQYGSPEDNFGMISDFWSVYLGPMITPEDVACMMALLKISRIRTGGHFKADSWVDAIGYLACGAEIASHSSDNLQIQMVGGKHSE